MPVGALTTWLGPLPAEVEPIDPSPAPTAPGRSGPLPAFPLATPAPLLAALSSAEVGAALRAPAAPVAPNAPSVAISVASSCFERSSLPSLAPGPPTASSGDDADVRAMPNSEYIASFSSTSSEVRRDMTWWRFETSTISLAAAASPRASRSAMRAAAQRRGTSGFCRAESSVNAMGLVAA